MKALSFFSVILFIGSIHAMEQYKNTPTNSRFSSVMGQSLLQVGRKEDSRILIKEGTFFSGSNQIIIYKTDGTQVGKISPSKTLGSTLVKHQNNDDQFAISYGNGVGLFDLERCEPIIEFNADETENPSRSIDFKFQTADNMILTKKAPLGNYTYFFDSRNGKNPQTTFQTGYDSINPEGTLSVSFDDLTSVQKYGYARSFVPKANSIIKSFIVPDDLKMCTPDSLKLIAGRDNTQGVLISNEVYDVRSGERITGWQVDPNWTFFTEQPSQDSRYLAQVTDNTIHIYNLTSGVEEETLNVAEGFMPFGIWFSPDNQQLITVSNNSLGADGLNKNSKLVELGLVAHLISKEKRKVANDPKQGQGMVNIWDINLEKPQESKPAKTSNSWWPSLGLW